MKIKPFFVLLLPFLAQLVCCSSNSAVVELPSDTGALETSVASDSNHVNEVEMLDAISETNLVDSIATETKGLSTHFRTWLQNYGYGQEQFARDDLGSLSFGGKLSDSDTVTKTPIVFVHGNSDSAVGVTGTSLSGFTASRNAFLQAGYKDHELYAMTWGPADPSKAMEQRHSKAYILYLRRFFEAVLAYTQRSKINVIAHSMGVTLARAAIRGGTWNDREVGTYTVGAPLTDKIHAFIGISGANLGLTTCYLSQAATCNKTDGFFPGTRLATGEVIQRSEFLSNLLKESKTEGHYVASVYSTSDELIGGYGLVWGNYTSQIPGQDDELRIVTPSMSHNQTKDLTTTFQLNFVNKL